MVEQPVGEHKYHSILEDIDDEDMITFISRIRDSLEYDLDGGFILLKNKYTDWPRTIVGYLDRDKIYLVDRHVSHLRPHHVSLLDLLSSCI